MELFSHCWSALHEAVTELPDEAFALPSGCAGWLVRDLVFHLAIDAQDVLVTLATPTEAEPTRNALTYWEVSRTPPAGDDPLDALNVRLAAAYEEPRLLKFHLDNVGPAADRAAAMAAPERRVVTRGEVLTTGDYLLAHAMEWTLHHLDLVAHLPGTAGPPAEGLARSRGGAGGDRRGRLPRLVLRRRRTADRHRATRPDLGREGRARCAGRGTPLRPRLSAASARTLMTRHASAAAQKHAGSYPQWNQAQEERELRGNRAVEDPSINPL